MKKLFLVDISSFIFRAYYAVRPLNTKDGTPVNAVYGVVSMMNKLIDKHQPDYMIVCRDLPDKGFRHELYPEYKANRSAPPEDLVPQFSIIKDFIDTYPINSVEQPGFEADDIIATLVNKYKTEKDMEIYIVSSDKDLMQLVGKNVFLYDTMKEKVFKTVDVKEKFGVGPEKVIDVQSLCGDASDNIPGIAGVGPKTASKLINEYGSLEKVLDNAQNIKGKLGEKIVAGKDSALISQKLVSLSQKVPIDLSWDHLATKDKNIDALNAFYKKLDFNRFIINGQSQIKTGLEKIKGNYITIDSTVKLKELVETIMKDKPKYLSLDTETDSVNALNANIVGMSLCYSDQTAYYIPIAHKQGVCLSLDDVLAVLEPVLINNDIGKIGQNIKYDLNVLSPSKIKINNVCHDTLIASYLVDPAGQHNLDFLAKKYLGKETILFKDLVDKKQTFADVPIDKATAYAAEDALVVYLLLPVILEELEKNNLLAVYEKLEVPLISVLANMEQNGALVNLELLDTLKIEFKQRLLGLEKEIYALAGEEFNINSTKQLSVILFDKLSLPVIKKTKTGYSTDVGVLQELAIEHDLPRQILEYRSIAKLLSTYVEQLKGLIHPKTNRVHTHFNQAVVTTGRLSSTEPNLQNIPIRTKEGKRIRESFVAPKGSWIMSLDYSQIELRLLADFSKDPHLLDAYQKNQDIHARTAAHIFGMSIDEVSEHERSIGKTINFGVVYGQSPYGLAKQLGIPNKEAKRFIDSFYHEFSRVKDYKEHIINKAKEDEFVTTFLGRKRYLPEINSRNHLARQNAERMAFNTVFQGSAADLIKKAMIKIHKLIQKDRLHTKMIMQVHDELVFEVPDEELMVVKKLFPKIMEKTFELSIPLSVTCHVGQNWAQAH